MTELEIYKEKYNDDDTTHIDKPTKELAEQWLDAKFAVKVSLFITITPH